MPVRSPAGSASPPHCRPVAHPKARRRKFGSTAKLLVVFAWSIWRRRPLVSDMGRGSFGCGRFCDSTENVPYRAFERRLTISRPRMSGSSPEKPPSSTACGSKPRSSRTCWRQNRSYVVSSNSRERARGSSTSRTVMRRSPLRCAAATRRAASPFPARSSCGSRPHAERDPARRLP